jgi:hypothetical protein
VPTLLESGCFAMPINETIGSSSNPRPLFDVQKTEHDNTQSRVQNPTEICLEMVNLLIQNVNTNVKTMINNLCAKLPGSRFTYIDIAHMFLDIATNTKSYGTLF